jgi:hypothetical protein
MWLTTKIGPSASVKGTAQSSTFSFSSIMAWKTFESSSLKLMKRWINWKKSSFQMGNYLNFFPEGPESSVSEAKHK